MIARRPEIAAPPAHVMRVAIFHRFFRRAAGLNIDKQDLKRYSDFINRKLYDLLLRGEAAAKANGRDIIEPFDLPITKGLQESMLAFPELDEEIEVHFPVIVGALSVALARTFKIIDPDLKEPSSEDWERCSRRVAALAIRPSVGIDSDLPRCMSRGKKLGLYDAHGQWCTYGIKNQLRQTTKLSVLSCSGSARSNRKVLASEINDSTEGVRSVVNDAPRGHRPSNQRFPLHGGLNQCSRQAALLRSTTSSPWRITDIR